MINTFQLKNQDLISYTVHPLIHADIQYAWTLKVESSRPIVNYRIIPDASIDIIFESYSGNLYNPSISAPFRKITTIQLPKNKTYFGIRFKPGSFRKYIDIDVYKLSSYFYEFSRKEYRDIFDFIDTIGNNKANPLSKFDNRLDKLINSNLSQKQKRRIFKSTTGFTIRDFNKIIKFQKSLINNHTEFYYDQSHKARAYKELTGMSPKEIEKHL